MTARCPVRRAALAAAPAPLLPLLVTIAACAPTLERHEFREIHMGCEARIVLYAASASNAADAARAAFDRIAAVDAALSDWRPDSESEQVAAKFDSDPGPDFVEIGETLATALRCALCVHRLTAGRFDPTLGSVTRLWRRQVAGGAAPSAAEIEHARRTTGARWIELDGRRLAIRRRGLRFDFGGIGKGLAAEEARRELGRRGCPRALVQIAGDGSIGRAPPGRGGWRVRVESTGEIVELGEGSAISSSGDAEQWVEVDGVRRSHIIDPRSGVGVSGAPAVTVIVTGTHACPECDAGALADGIATGATLLPRREIEAMTAALPGVRVILTPPTVGQESPPGPAPSR